MVSQGVLGAVRRRWRWLGAMTVLVALAALVWSLASTPTYRATSSVFFSLNYGGSASDLVQGSAYAQNQVASYALLVTTPAVLQPVIDRLDLQVRPAELAAQIEAAAPADTVVVEVTVTDTSASQSARVANAVVESLSTVVESLAPRDEAGDPTVRATTVAEAEQPRAAASPDLPLNLAIGVAAGLLLGVGAAVARDLQDNRVRDADVVAQVTSLPILGTVPARTGQSARSVVVETDPHSPHAEAFRQLRTNLQFLAVPSRERQGGTDRVQVVAVTSALSAEGKSTVASNLAAALAETGAAVLLIDADLRRPSVADLLGVEGAAGLTTVLVGHASMSDVVQEWGSSGLQVLAAGPVPPNPSELLGSPAMGRLLEEVRASFDYVVLDTAPLLPVADAAILSRSVDGTMVVANATRVRRHQLADSLRMLSSVDARVLGVTLNEVRREGEAYSYRRQDLATERPAGLAARPKVAAAAAVEGPAVAPGRDPRQVTSGA